MSTNPVFNIYLIGVGGQGIGLLSEVVIRAVDHAGFDVVGVDTHGLAQRGGTVESHIRIGESDISPLVSANSADLVVSLERTEAYRALLAMAGDGSRLVYYDTLWQPLSVRLRQEPAVTPEEIEDAAAKMNVTVYKVRREDLPDPKMQNVVVLAAICRKGWIPGVGKAHYEQAMSDLLPPRLLSANMDVFHKKL